MPENKLIEINISKDDDYHTQINNKLIPFESCNTTSCIMALKNTGIKYYCPENIQDEDYLTSILLTDEAYNKMYELFPKKYNSWMYDQDGKLLYKPQNLFAMLEWGINNKLVGKKVCTFNEYGTMQQMLFNTVKGGSVVVSGKFTKSGHIVCVSGFVTGQQNIYSLDSPDQIDIDFVPHVIVDDPYGNYWTQYKDTKGNNIKFDLEDFNHLVSKVGVWNEKWLLLFDYNMKGK